MKAAEAGGGPAARGTRVRVAQVELLRDNLPSIVIGTFAGGCLIAGFLAYLTEHDTAAWWWLATLAVVSLVRAGYTLVLHRTPTTVANVERRIAVLTALIVPAGMLWGALGWYAGGSEDPMIIVVVVMTLVGLVSSAAGFISHLRGMFMSYVGLVMVPVALRLVLLEADGWRWLGALVVAFVLVSVATARATARAVRHALRLRFENTDLVERLGAEVRRADEALAEAERASRAKSVFLGAASHDLRQPLHSLRLLSTTLEARMRRPRASDDDGTAERALVRRMDESVRALEALFESILDVSRLDAGTLGADVRDVALAPVLDRVRRQFGPPAHLAGLGLVVASTTAWVHTDPLLLERLLGNLVGNALRYTPEGGVRVTVGAAPQSPPGGRVRIAVVDTGIGIPDVERERVFEEFVQLGNPERDRSRGIGLGLSIVRRLAALLDIEVELDSRIGRGTRFVLGVRAGVAGNPMASADEPGVDAPVVPAGLVVLVVEDERDVREATCALLESWGCVTLAAGSRAEALAGLDALGRVPDVIVSDYRLRGAETGLDAIRAVRERAGTAVPALLVTGDVSAQRLVEMRDSGLPVLHKPCAPDVLAEWLVELSPGPGGAGHSCAADGAGGASGAGA